MTTTCGVLVGSSFLADFYARRRVSVLDLLGQNGKPCKKLFIVLVCAGMFVSAPVWSLQTYAMRGCCRISSAISFMQRAHGPMLPSVSVHRGLA